MPGNESPQDADPVAVPPYEESPSATGLVADEDELSDEEE
jgi:hypothetical protein